MAGGLQLKVAPNKVASAREPLRAVIYGDPGVGKTTLAISFPRPFIINTNRGLEGDAVEGRDDLVEHKPSGFKDLEGIYYYIKDHSEEFDTIVFDSLDSLVRLLLNEVVDDGDPIGDYDVDKVPAQRDYLSTQKQVERILDDFRRLGKHIVLTGGVRQPQKDGAPVGKRRIEASDGVAKVVHDWASLVGELVAMKLDDEGKPSPTGTRRRVLFIDPSSEKRECKARWARLLPHVLDPTFPVIWDKITTKEVK